MTPHSRKADSLMGALTADAAALGLHWIYDVERIAQIIGEGSAAFTPLDQANFEGVPAYYAHTLRCDGMLSQYGEVLSLAMRSIGAHGSFDAATYQAEYAAHFGSGGRYMGYIDRPTRGTLENIAKEQTSPSGIDDDQHPAIATLPALVAANQLERIKDAIEVTNVNPIATHYGQIFAKTLSAVQNGTALKEALAQTADPKLAAALNTPETSSAIYGETTQRACHLPQGMPLSWHILDNTDSYEDAVEANIKAGGDSCGRAIIIGALAGAHYGQDAIPLRWSLTLDNADKLLDTAHTIASF